MKHVANLNRHYGRFFLRTLPEIAFIPYKATYQLFGGNNPGGTKALAITACILLTPLLLPLTITTLLLAKALAVLAYPVALLKDACSEEPCFDRGPSMA